MIERSDTRMQKQDWSMARLEHDFAVLEMRRKLTVTERYLFLERDMWNSYRQTARDTQVWEKVNEKYNDALDAIRKHFGAIDDQSYPL